LALLGVSLIVGVSSQEAILEKTGKYLSNESSLSNIFNVALLCSIGFVVLQDRLPFALGMLPMLTAITYIGGSRVNMISVSLAIYMFGEQKRTEHILVRAILVYFSVKSIFFVQNILQYGTGFATE
jgi:hypothetical protein